jgi:subtilisin family serine protease
MATGSGTLATPTASRSVDFTGEGSTNDAYGHGFTAGITQRAPGNRRRPLQHAGSPTGGVATGANLVDVRVLNSQGIGTVAGVIAGIDWAIKAKCPQHPGDESLTGH